MIRFAVTVVAMTACFLHVSGQQRAGMQMIKAAPTVCYASNINESTIVGLSAEYLRYKALKGSSRSQSANIEVTYEGFHADAQAAFQEAVDIWESILVTNVKIRIHARWTPLATGVLGSAGPAQYVNNFKGAPKENVWYPIALAEKIAGTDINDPSEYDIEAAFNSQQSSWFFGLTGSNPPFGQYDLVTIVLHEIGHGLGITHGYDVSNDQAVIPTYFDGMPVVYETNLQSGNGMNFVYSFTPPSATLKNVITGKSLFFSSYLVKQANANTNATVYAPSTYSSGSSIAHLDETTYPAGNINSLMTPQIGASERILDPGPIVRAIMKEIGWVNTTVEHTPLKDTEDVSGQYHTVAKIRNDIGYDQNSVTLVYYTNTDPVTVGTTINMTPTGNPDEYQADIPGGSPDYYYLIYVVDNDGRFFYNVPETVTPGIPPTRDRIHFHVGPDVTPPLIQHTKREFATNIDDFVIDAVVTDNIAVSSVTLQWKLNDVGQADMPMTLVAATESTYKAIISKSAFKVGDEIAYRIRAEDTSVAGNVSYNPDAITFNTVTITGLGETRDSYANNFDDLAATDFFGTGFTITKDQSFNGHMQSSPIPYPAGGVGGHVDLIYTLKYPIRIAAEDAILKFDEIAMVEPGEPLASWPSEAFYDYAVVEGSLDGGVTWTAIADGYDCNYNSVWKDLWNSTFDGQNSSGVPTPSLYRPHQFNLLDKFHTGDEVALRFRLYSDPFATGWGWAIDNLKVQIDDTPPTIRHQQVDYVMEGSLGIMLNMEIKDSHGLGHVFVDYKVNNGSTSSAEIIVNPASDMYSSTIDLSVLGVKAGDDFQYLIRAIDPFNNIGTFPATGFITTAVISLSSPLDEIVSDFSTSSSKLTGNFFSVVTANGNGTMSTDHPYNLGLDSDGISDFTFMTRQPVKVSKVNPRIYYTDIALVEYNGTGVKDYVVVEASKDGVTWQQLIQPYAANAFADWKSAYDAGGAPTAQTKYQLHQFDITAGGNFKAGDVILVRFRLRSDSLKSGWGWSVDDLSIQGSVTGLEPQIANEIVRAWPNPVAGGSLYLKMTLPAASDVSVEVLNAHGQLVSSDKFSAPPGDFQREYNVGDWSDGVYFVKVKSIDGTSVLKLIKLR